MTAYDFAGFLILLLLGTHLGTPTVPQRWPIGCQFGAPASDREIELLGVDGPPQKLDHKYLLGGHSHAKRRQRYNTNADKNTIESFCSRVN